MSTNVSLLVIGMSIMTVIIALGLWRQLGEQSKPQDTQGAFEAPLIFFSEQQLEQIQNLLDSGEYDQASQQLQAWNAEIHTAEDNENLALLSSLLSRLQSEHQAQT